MAKYSVIQEEGFGSSGLWWVAENGVMIYGTMSASAKEADEKLQEILQEKEIA